MPFAILTGMHRIKKLFKRTHSRVTNDQAKGAQKTMLEELFNDYYIRRRDVYKMNFIRGIFFGFGSVLGGTIVIALALWFFSLFAGFPVIGDLFREAQNSINAR